MNTYTAVSGQSIYDICIITYGSLDFTVKLATDNGITDLNDTVAPGTVFTYNNSLVVNQALHQQINQQYGTANNIIYGTAGGYYHDGYYDSAFD